MKKVKIGVIGLGYVGLPLARLFATKYAVVGFDINKIRVKEILQGKDRTKEVAKTTLQLVLKKENDNKKGLFCAFDSKYLEECNYYIVTVPTPIDIKKKPNLQPLLAATKTVGRFLSKEDIVIYESTVYPGTTEEVCVPVLEKESKLTFNKDFFVGYSPERINPGDKKHTVENTLKITSGSNKITAKKVDELYRSVIRGGTYLAPSVKVAEAAKVIENSQRDINIAFVNELSKIFNLLNIDTNEVLKAASTKWNFLNFKPGLVGGHCIGVDPYYLAQKAQEVGYHPEIILAGRRMNDSMANYVASEVVKLLVKSNFNLKEAQVLVLGITFKENCTDVRNTKVADVVKNLNQFGVETIIVDPLADKLDLKKEYNLEVENEIRNQKYHGIILAVPHKEFLKLNLKKHLIKGGIIYDVKSVLKEKVDGKL